MVRLLLVIYCKEVGVLFGSFEFNNKYEFVWEEIFVKK